MPIDAMVAWGDADKVAFGRELAPALFGL